MEIKTKRFGILDALKSIFSSEIDYEENYEMGVTLPKELADAKKKIEEKESKVRQGFNVTNKGGVAPKINPDTEKAMRAMHSKVAKKETVDREIGD